MRVRCAHCDRDIDSEGPPPSACPSCGTRLATAEATTLRISDATVLATASRRPVGAPPESVAGYRVLRLLGMGGMGQVFVAEAPATGRQVALKLLSPEIACEPDAIERFRLEGRLAGMIDHPRCVFVYAADEDRGLPYIVMELMPGKSLQDLLSAGPLDPEDAVRKTLDVAEGLEEAHRLGVIHRDVKPSNCFLDADGRVKVGDFGLSKWISADARLTQTGAFVGTPLYASPEQLKGEALDARTDVYSVCATLYALLTGSAPFQGSNPVAMLARIVSETAPTVRTLRPGVSAALDRVVMKGIERDREARWRDMRELREALMPFVSGPPSGATLGLRVCAFLVDTALLALGTWGASEAIARLWSHGYSPLLTVLGTNLPWIAYFALLEGRWGAGVGKWLMRLRVRDARGPDPPGVKRSLARVGVLFAFIHLLGEVAAALPASMLPSDAGWLDTWQFWTQLVGIVLLCVTMRKRNGYRGLHDLASGTRVVQHVRAVRRVAGGASSQAASQPASRVEGLPARLGPYRVSGAYRWQNGTGVLLAEDPSLGRRVLVDVRRDAAPTAEARRSLARASRLRWLGTGREGDLTWEAYVAPAGRPLTSAVSSSGPWSWEETREVLDPLSQELVAAAKDGTLPRVLAPDQVWVQPEGHIQVVDVPLGEVPPCADEPDPARRGLALAYGVALAALTGSPPAAADPRLRRYASPAGGKGVAGVCEKCLSEVRARNGEKSPCPGCGREFAPSDEATLEFERGIAVVTAGLWCLIVFRVLGTWTSHVGKVFALALLGLLQAGWRVRRRLRAERCPLLASVPLHAQQILDRLPGGTNPYPGPDALQRDLSAVRDRVAQVGAWQRGRQLVSTAGLFSLVVFVFLPLQLIFLASFALAAFKVQAVRVRKVVSALEDGTAERVIASAPAGDLRTAAAREFLGGPAAREKVRSLQDSLQRRTRAREAKLGLFAEWIDKEVQSALAQATGVDPTKEMTLDDLAIVAGLVASEREGSEPPLGWAAAQASVFRFLWILMSLWLALAMAMRGGIFLHTVGMAVVRRDGLPASPLRCAWRASLVWVPLCAAIGTAGWLEQRYPDLPWLAERVRYMGVTHAAVALVLGGVWLALALRSPDRSPADAIAGTRLVPR